MFLLRNRADFRALGIKRQRSSSSLSVLHIYTIGGEEKPWCVPSAAAINSLETPPRLPQTSRNPNGGAGDTKGRERGCVCMRAYVNVCVCVCARERVGGWVFDVTL